MKLVMPHRPTKNSSAQAVTHPLRADLAPLDHFSSMGKLTGDFVPFPATHHHHIHYRPEFVLIAPIHSDT